jgi:hypothetical protein
LQEAHLHDKRVKLCGMVVMLLCRGCMMEQGLDGTYMKQCERQHDQVNQLQSLHQSQHKMAHAELTLQ